MIRTVEAALARLAERPDLADDIEIIAAELARHDEFVRSKESQIGRLEARARDAEARAERLRIAVELIEPIGATLSFLGSVIASGEPPSAHTRRAVDDAHERIRVAMGAATAAE